MRRAGKKHCTDTYRYVNQVPLRNSDDALMVNWCELATTAQDVKVLFRNAWDSSYCVTRDKPLRWHWQAVRAGRTRTTTRLKTKGYHFEHNFGHGKQHLSNLFATMILLAFLFHATLDMTGGSYRTVRSLFDLRRASFEHLRALIQYIPFDDWNHLFHLMLKGLDAEPPNTG